jgi:5-methylthioadenosine/S-adenosylhomocysteine deaminase
MRRAPFLLTSVGLLGLIALLVFVTARGQQGTQVSLLVSGGTVVTMEQGRRVIPDGAVAISGDRIVAVGPADEIARQYRADQTIDTRGQIVLPGLINTHTHAPMVMFRGLADDMALMDWLNNYIFPAEAKTVSPELVRIGTRLAALEMIQSGTTTFADMYYFEDDIAAATKEAGLRAVLGQSVIKFPVTDALTPEEGLARAEAFIKKWQNDPLITPAVAPHAPYTLEPHSLKAARDLANRYNVPALIHLAETQDEVKVIREQRQASPTQYLESLGFWQGRSLAAHAVFLDDKDIATLVARGTGLAHNPGSNMKLASGIAGVEKWLAKGARAGLGTDGAASSNDLDMFFAMRLAALLHKVGTGDPRVTSALQVLTMATRGGAAALGLDSRIGSLEAGKQADLIAVTVDGARQTPMFDPVSHLVYVAHGDDVTTTIVAGRVLMRERQVQTLNPGEVLRDARAMAERVKRAVAPTSTRETK